MPTYTGPCSCRKIEYELSLLSPDDARTSLCHCRNCKVPKDSFSYTKGSPHQHAADNGSGVTIYREFCDTCGSFILEYGELAKDKFRYVTNGSLDDPEALQPKGEFFCKMRASWMPEIPGMFYESK
ncbi:unnamed protein product [Penicillium bialowiezense]